MAFTSPSESVRSVKERTSSLVRMNFRPVFGAAPSVAASSRRAEFSSIERLPRRASAALLVATFSRNGSLAASGQSPHVTRCCCMNELLHWRDFQHHAHATRLSDAHGTRKPLARTNSRACLEFFCSSMSEIASPPTGCNSSCKPVAPSASFSLLSLCLPSATLSRRTKLVQKADPSLPLVCFVIAASVTAVVDD